MSKEELEARLKALEEKYSDLQILVLGLIADGVTVHQEIQFIPDGTLDKVN